MFYLTLLFKLAKDKTTNPLTFFFAFFLSRVINVIWDNFFWTKGVVDNLIWYWEVWTKVVFVLEIALDLV